MHCAAVSIFLQLYLYSVVLIFLNIPFSDGLWSPPSSMAVHAQCPLQCLLAVLLSPVKDGGEKHGACVSVAGLWVLRALWW